MSVAVITRAAHAPRLPGFSASLAVTLAVVGSLVILPLLALIIVVARADLSHVREVLFAERTLAAYGLSLGAAALAAVISVPLGLGIAWSLVRYELPARRFWDALVDLPFAMPTAVSGIALTQLWGPSGAFGSVLAPLGLEVAFTRAGVVLALVFVSLPFVVRTVQPVIESFPRETEEAAASLGADRITAFRRVILPALRPALVAGATLGFARAIGEYGSVVFIAGNVPFRTEIAPLLVLVRLEEYDYAGAAAIATGMLVASAALLSILSRAEARRALSTEVAVAAELDAQRRERPRGLALAVAIGSLTTLGLLVLAPLLVVCWEALAEGVGTFAEAITDEETVSALGLTLLVVAIVVPFHTVFGVAAAWLLTRQDFRGKAILGTLIDLPFTVSPVVSGLLFVLLFGARGWLGPWLRDHDIRVVYAVPGVVLATLFVTLPFVVRELVPTMEAIGRDEEEAAASLGASGWQILWRVTLPRVRWALFYGCVLCGARAAGEFGAVSVVSGHVRGETNTLPLHVEILWGEYHTAAAFSVAAMLAASGLLTLVLRGFLERRVRMSKRSASSAAEASAAAVASQTTSQGAIA